MSDGNRVFFDTNILVYAYDRSELQKSKIAAHLIQEAWAQHHAVTSFQVLQEFLVTVIWKIETPLPLEEVEKILKNFCTLEPVVTNHEIVFDACRLQARYKWHYWDAAIVAQALSSNCTTLYSEDFQDGFKIDGLTMKNPFAVG